MDSNSDLIEKDLNLETKKFYQTKKFWIIISIFILVLIIIGIILIINFRRETEQINFEYEIIQSELGSQNILVKWNFNSSVNISINVKGVENEIIRTYNIYNSTIGEKLIKVYYGMPKLYIKVQNYLFEKQIEKQFKIPAKEILFAAFPATLDSLLFSLNIFNITKNFSCPIYVFLSRYRMWNWTNLPENVFLFDILDENNYQKFNYYRILDKLKIWINQIYQLNNSTLFNLFINDYHTYVIPICLFANNIPPENYKIYMLSDGTGSYLAFNKIFNDKDTYIQNYNNMKNKYYVFRDYIRKRKSYDKDSRYSKNINYRDLRSYAYIILKEENNTFWWLTKIEGAFAPNNSEVLQELLNNSNIEEKNINSLFKSLDKEQKEIIKDLFDLNSNFFEEAYKQNKSVMLIIGTHANVEKNLYDYCLTTQLFYKDNYIYYYKAHPSTPIEDDQKKINNLKNISVLFVDSNIPFEMILYFNPNISCSGYYSSSFLEVGKQNLKSLFGQYKQEGEYYDKFDYFCQYIKNNDKKYGQYLNGNSDGTVLEINNNKLIDFKYDFGIYLKNNKSIVYYKNNETFLEEKNSGYI